MLEFGSCVDLDSFVLPMVICFLKQMVYVHVMLSIVFCTRYLIFAKILFHEESSNKNSNSPQVYCTSTNYVSTITTSTDFYLVIQVVYVCNLFV